MHYEPPPVWSFAPFVLLLLSIAILPLIHRTAHWWEHNRNKLLVSLVLAVLMIAYYAFIHPGVKAHGAPPAEGDAKAHVEAPASPPPAAPPGAHGPEGAAAAVAPASPSAHEGEHLVSGLPAVVQVLHHAVILDYIPFIILLFSLYTISGGILLRGDIAAKPLTNCGFLGIGAILASFMGTTGASMLLIRPLLKTNSERKHVVHTVIFFIFMVSNIGGCLTPLGDPPLFLGYLRNVPFWWTLQLFFPWLLANAVLLAIYFVWDTIAYRHETPRDIVVDQSQVTPLSLLGLPNFLWLLCVVACVATVDAGRELPVLGVKPPPFTREAILLVVTALSWFTTPRNAEIRRENRFNFVAITEVAFLFIGIFICMQAPVEFLIAKGPELGVSTAPAFFWATGGLSSFLDNAPTYVVFFGTAMALGPVGGVAVPVVNAGVQGAIDQTLLLAVSLGAVFMGANTYIGNGPNFMVKTIAEQSGVKMPSFFGYMAYSVGILIPLFVAIMFVFLV